MKSIYSTIAAVFLLGASCSQLHIPPVDAVVKSLLHKEDAYVHFSGNQSVSKALSERQASSYWYENIQHQGISAFGPSGYKVYRNVKDYGAKGNVSYLYNWLIC